jgi:sugar lactone lactonase YvrE
VVQLDYEWQAANMVELFLDAAATLGESPRYSAADNCLYWVDIDACRVHRTDLATKADDIITLPEQIGCLALCQSGGLMLGMESGFFHMSSWGAPLEAFGPSFLADKPHQRLNDGCVDPRGRFWAGTVTSDKSLPDAALYRLDPDGSVNPIFGGLLTSNGAAFTADETAFYHADTPTHAIRRYPYDAATGLVGTGELFHQFEMHKGRPDGGALDEEGCYWTALFDGGRVVRLSPQGEILQTVEIPTVRPTMISFGGEDRKTAFVTTASKGLDAEQLAAQPHAGGIFSFAVSVAGQKQWTFAI